MYVFKNFIGRYGHCTLQEMTAREFREAVAAAPKDGDVFYERCSAERARAWVKCGYHHSTPLYIDTYRNRVVYGRDGMPKGKRVTADALFRNPKKWL